MLYDGVREVGLGFAVRRIGLLLLACIGLLGGPCCVSGFWPITTEFRDDELL